MIPLIYAGDGAENKQISAMLARAAAKSEKVDATVAEIMENVRCHGFAAVEAYSLRFDGAAPREISREELEAAASRCPAALRDAMEKSAAHIRDYQSRILPQSQQWETPGGGMLGLNMFPLERVGIYVPGGAAAYPSSVLMNAVPAKVAGVKEIVMVTPPTKNLNDAVLTAALIAEVDRVIALGGVQAIAALTYGAGFVPRVDKLVGPGNAYVAAAKRRAFGLLDIDMIAGPSELLVIADETAKPSYVAADLLSQAEHDPMASAVLVTTSAVLAEKVREELYRQAEKCARKETILRSLDDYGALIVCSTLDAAVEIAARIAPEHLEILTAAPEELASRRLNAGAVFLGEFSPEPYGDYMAGPSHVLPTSGTARFFSPLSAQSFMKGTSLIRASRSELTALHGDIERFALAEGLDAHANAVRIRFEEGI